jgi:uncharacterized protein YqgC (DUF456 family)
MSFLYWFLVAVMVLGIIGAVVPAIPGISLIAVAILCWGIAIGFVTGSVASGFASINIALPVAIVLLLAGTTVDFLAAYWGARQAGASKWGQIGAIVGSLLGLLGLLPTLPFAGPFGPILGILLGSILGAIIGEFFYRRDLNLAVRAAMGIVVGSIVGNLIQGLLAIITVAVFLWTTLPQIS